MLSINRISLWLTLAAGTLVRLAHINQPMRFDEAITFVRYGALPLRESLTNYNNPNNHLLNTLLMRLSTQLTGSIDPWVLRLPVFFAGVLLIVAVYWTGKRFFGDHTALLAAALVAVYPQIIFYATNARGYSFVALSFIVLLGLAYDLCRQSSRKQWVVFVFVAVMGFYAVPSMIYPFGIVCLWLFLSILIEQVGQNRRSMIRDLIPAVIAVGVLTWLLYAPVMRPGMREALSRSAPLEQFLPALSSLLQGTLILWQEGIPGIIFLLLVVGFIVAVMVERRTNMAVVPLWGTAITAMMVMLFIQRPLSISHNYFRLVFFLLPLCLILAASGIVYLLNRLVCKETLLIGVLSMSISVGGGFMVIETETVYNWKETGLFLDAADVTLFLGDELRPGDAILCYGPCRETLHYYFMRDGLDPAPIYADINQADRVIVVMNRFEFMGQSLGIPIDDYVFYQFDEDNRALMGELTLLAEFGSAKVYGVLFTD
jgi:hypothetical protein